MIATGAEVEDFPSYSLTPQSGPEASKELHKKIPLRVIPDMAGAGYSLDLIFSLLAREVNGIRSVGIDAGGGLIGGSPKFRAMLLAMKHLDADDKISVSSAIWEEKLFEHAFAPEVFSPSEVVTVREATHRYTSTDDGQSYFVTGKSEQAVFWMATDARGSGPGKELLRLLRLDPNYEKSGWVLRDRQFASEAELHRNSRISRSQIAIQTRSIYGVLNLMSQGVEVPPCDEAFACSGEPFLAAVRCGKAPDIQAAFEVHFSERRPSQAFVAVKHRSGWFYIDDADWSSKKYFNALFDLYNLSGPQRIESGSSDQLSSPVLTLR